MGHHFIISGLLGCQSIKAGIQWLHAWSIDVDIPDGSG